MARERWGVSSRHRPFSDLGFEEFWGVNSQLDAKGEACRRELEGHTHITVWRAVDPEEKPKEP